MCVTNDNIINIWVPFSASVNSIAVTLNFYLFVVYRPKSATVAKVNSFICKSKLFYFVNNTILCTTTTPAFYL